MAFRGLAPVALSAAVALGACGGETRTVTVTQGQSVPATTAGDPGAPEGVGEGRGSASGTLFTLRIDELRRSGATVILNATLITDAAAEEDLRIGDLFGDGRRQELERAGDHEDADVFDGVALIDGHNRKKYLVARDAAGRCVCSADLSSVVAEPGVAVSLTATLGAPPGGVTSLDVVVPNVRTFAGVPLAG
jgi:hypothetical protein